MNIHILLQVDRKLYKSFLKYLHDHEDEKEKIVKMSRKGPKVYTRHTLLCVLQITGSST